MKKFKQIWMWMAIATASFSFTSCDDDDYWYDDYNHGGWGWNQGDRNNGSNGSQDDYLLSEAQTLIGDWRGSVLYSELAEDGQSRDNYSFNAEMTFYQTGNKVNTLCGDGVEVDYADDGSNETQTLKFTWYIDNNGDIYIRYNKSGFTYVLDLGSSQSGFYLGEEKGRDVFYGYMIGTGAAKGDVMQIDLERYNPSGARKKTRSAATDSVAPSFGKATGRAFMPHAIKKLPRR
ncbi:MAG: hypothetical protein U0K32_03035 [Segatella copri]|nr:hypothetical protein [Segatella copri]